MFDYTILEIINRTSPSDMKNALLPLHMTADSWLSRAILSGIFRNANRSRATRMTNPEEASSSSNDPEKSMVIDMEDVAEHHENQSRRGSISFDEFMNE
ncbi:hypothetical protein EDC96DRAFT_581619 [Choanephora cucurbitarum]|nr:hypothetical protein EDC96DRAFT_581619 [Choanephora cucurbitarum]